MTYIRKSISIQKETHQEWIKKNSINLSQFLQAKIDYEIELDKKVKEDLKEEFELRKRNVGIKDE